MEIQFSDYTIDNLLGHLKALRALGLWKMEWEEVAALLGMSDSDLAVIGEIGEVLIEKMAVALNLPSESGWGEISLALGVKENASFTEVVDALYDKKRAEELALTTGVTSESKSL